MNILAINGSPRGASGNTEVLVRAFLEGAARDGDSVETVYLKDKNIHHCTGCFTCWFKTPGVCAIKDDMASILADRPQTDILVLASPLYFFTYNGLMKNFIDRLIPMAQPFIDIKDGICTHPWRYPGQEPKSIVLISNSGFPEQSHFDGMKKSFHQGFGEKSGTICCAGGALLKVPEVQEIITWYIDATRAAGRELAETGAISPETQAVLDKPLVDDALAYAERANELWRSMGLERIG